MTKSYFIIGTDTNVGKTYISSALVRYFVSQGYKTVGMKPIASGCEMAANGDWINADVQALQVASNVSAPLDAMNPYRFIPAIAPHIAAAQTQVEMTIQVVQSAFIKLTQLAEIVVIEGAGGFCVPINAKETMADLSAKLDVPIVLVVGMRLGCINHALLTVEALTARGLTLAGWVANQIDPTMPMFKENLASLQQRIQAPCLSVVGWNESVKFNF